MIRLKTWLAQWIKKNFDYKIVGEYWVPATINGRVVYVHKYKKRYFWRKKK